MTIGQHINLVRSKHNVTLAELERKSGVSQWTLCGWIYKGSDPSITLLICVADALGVTLDELVGRTVKNDK